MKMKLIFASLIFGLFFLTIYTWNTPTSQAQQTGPIPTPTPTPTTIPPADPKLLYIPKLNVYAVIENVGVDDTGKMETPKDFNDVGWYDLGFRPGAQGSAVIDGHLDTVTGAPAVFYYLSKLQPGDQIIVTDNNGTQYTFDVKEKVSYPYDNAPINQIINSTDKKRLNLITCNGTWDYKTHNYSNRIVIYSELEE